MEEDDHTLHSFFNLADNLDAHSLAEVSELFATLKYEGSRYDTLELIGEGSLKSVYRCFDQRTRRAIALAKPRDGLAVDYYDYFIYEAWLTSALSHPNIIKVYDVNLDEEGLPFFTMDLKGKTTLKKLVADTSDLNALLEVLMKVCDAMSYAHSRGVIHLDLKPDNILCDSFGEVLVCDWGIGKIVGSDDPFSEGNTLNIPELPTLHGHIKGSPGFMAPEQVQQDYRDERTDLYALGAILHYILTGEPPFTGTPSEILHDTVHSPLPPLSERGASRPIPAELDAVVQKAVQKAPSDRYESVQEFKSELSRYLSGYRTRAERPSAIKVLTSFTKRHRVKIVPILISALLIALISGILGWRNQQLNEDNAQLSETKSTLEQDIHSLSAEIDTAEKESDALELTISNSKLQLHYKLIEKAHSYLTLKASLRKTEVRDHLKNAILLKSKAQESFPRSHALKNLEMRIHFITMNFSALQAILDQVLDPNAHKRYARIKDSSERIKDLIAFAPHYQFTEDRRPTIEEITTYLQNVTCTSPQDFRWIYSMVLYDLSHRHNQEEKLSIYQCLTNLLRHHEQALDLQYEGERLLIRVNTSYDANSSPLP